jgi:hypothetical protein
VNHSDTVLCIPAAGDIVYANGAGSWDALGVGANNAVLYVDPATGLPGWFGIGPADSILGSDANQTLAWLAKGDTNASLSVDVNGHLAWRTFQLLDPSHHYDTAWTQGGPHHGSIIAGSDTILPPAQVWKELEMPAADGCPLVTADGEMAGLKWLDGPSFTQDVPDGVPYWDGNTLKQKYRTWTISKGLVTARGDEQVASILSKSTFQCPE